MNFEFATATRIVFGEGKRAELFGIAKGMGRRVLLVTGRDAVRADWARNGLARAGLGVEVISVAGEPTVADAERGAGQARNFGAELVVAVGGGSAIDAGKAMAALAANSGAALEYLEVIGAGRALERDPLPFVAVPTTAGTGAEVTRNAVLASPEHQVKVSLRSAKMLPRVALVDPELTYDLPRELTASTGLDALTQLIEPFLCSKANPMTDALCREAIPLVARALLLAFRNGLDPNARGEMALGSLFGGLALANAGLGAVHGFAAPIGGMFPAPHGAVCAALLPQVMAVNERAMRERAPTSPILRRFEELDSMFGGKAIEAVKRLCETLGVKPLREYGIKREDSGTLCDRAAQSSSMKANPITLTPGELAEILERAV